MKSTDKLYDFFDTDFPLNREGVKELINSFDSCEYQKGDFLLQNGNREKQLRFLISGVVREFYALNDKETNINFYTSPQFVNDFTSFSNNVISRKNQDCVTDVEILVLDKLVFSQLLEKYPCGKSFIDITFQRLLESKEEFEYNRLTKQPEDLYKIILKDHPDWLQLVPQYHIASFLGVTPETLSRIRKRM